MHCKGSVKAQWKPGGHGERFPRPRRTACDTEDSCEVKKLERFQAGVRKPLETAVGDSWSAVRSGVCYTVLQSIVVYCQEGAGSPEEVINFPLGSGAYYSAGL